VEEDDTGTNGRDKPRRGRPAYRRAACQIVVVVVVVVVVAGRQWSLIHNIPNQYVFDHGVRRKQSEPFASVHLLADPKIVFQFFPRC